MALQKSHKILLLLLLLSYPVYKGIREMVWVKHSRYVINNEIEIKLRVDDDILGFLDINSDKTILITNKITNAKRKITYRSISARLHFFLDTVHHPNTITLADEFIGFNTYNYTTLTLVNETDCFAQPGNCSSCNDSCLARKGKPYLTYDDKGFHR